VKHSTIESILDEGQLAYKTHDGNFFVLPIEDEELAEVILERIRKDLEEVADE
jgi:hypothetical protein